MEAILKEVNAVLGVTGSFVCLDDGNVAAQLLPRYTDVQVQSAARYARQMVQTLESAGVRVNEIVLAFNQGYMLLKNLRGGVLVIVCARDVNVPLLHLNANIAAKKLSEMLQPRVPRRRPKVEPVPMPTTATEETVSFPELEAEWRRIMYAATAAQVTLRVMGELGTWLCCPRARHLLTSPTSRQLDFGALATQRQAIQRLSTTLGYQSQPSPEEAARAARLVWVHPQRRITTEIHLDTWTMYHTLDLVPFLTFDEAPLPETALLLSRLQFVEMPTNVLRELSALLLQHEPSAHAEPGKIHLPVIMRLCADDLGWYKTVALNLQRVMTFALKTIAEEDRTVIIERALRITQAIEEASQSARWRARA